MFPQWSEIRVCNMLQNHKENIYLLSSTTVSIPSSELGLPTPSPASECVLPPEPKGEVTNSPTGEGGGGPDSDDWSKSLVRRLYSVARMVGWSRGGLQGGPLIFLCMWYFWMTLSINTRTMLQRLSVQCTFTDYIIIFRVIIIEIKSPSSRQFKLSLGIQKFYLV